MLKYTRKGRMVYIKGFTTEPAVQIVSFLDLLSPSAGFQNNCSTDLFALLLRGLELESWRELDC